MANIVFILMVEHGIQKHACSSLRLQHKSHTHLLRKVLSSKEEEEEEELSNTLKIE
jgi:hypothetical protein